MIPIKDDNPHYLTPYVTLGIIAINVLVWFVVQGMGDPLTVARTVCEYGAIPGQLFQRVSPEATVDLGPGRCIVGEPQWYTPLTAMFLHGGWMHLIGNMWFLWIFGNNVEDSMGHVRFTIFYVLCGLAAFVVQALSDLSSAVPMIGASGAIGGVMGAYIVLYPRVRVHLLIFLGFFVTTIAIPAIWMLGYWFALQLVGGTVSLGRTGGVAFWAHVGGFLGGAGLVLLFRKPELVRRHPYHGWSRPSPPQWRRDPRNFRDPTRPW